MSQNEVSGKYQQHWTYDEPYTTSNCDRMIYIYPEKDLRSLRIGLINPIKSIIY